MAEPNRPPQPVDNAALAQQAVSPAPSKPLTLGDVDAMRLRSLTANLRDQLALTEMYRDHLGQLQAVNAQLQDALIRSMQEKAAETRRCEKLAAELADVRKLLPASTLVPTEGGAA